ncbi:MAG: metallophosphoesterase [Nanoarchaeota archaeon]
MNKDIEALMEKGILISPDCVDDEELLDMARTSHDPDLLFVNSRTKEAIQQDQSIDWLAVDAELSREEHVLDALSVNHAPPVRLVSREVHAGYKSKINDFIGCFNRRFTDISTMLRTRQELAHLTSIGRIKGKPERENVSIIGMVKEKSETKNKNLMIEMEDQSGIIKVIINKNNAELFTLGRDIVLDETIGVVGQTGKNIIFANQVVLPNIPLGKEFKKHPDEIYMAIIGDTHFGAKLFLEDAFTKAINWLRGEVGSPEQRRIAKLVKYVIFTGDIAEGVGVYPNQDRDLTIKDIKSQYSTAARTIARIPTDKRIIIIPGNHDVGRIAEPQEPIPRKYAEDLHTLPNLTLVSSPAMVNIASTDSFPGFDILIYHGYSLIYYSDNVPSIREAGGQKRVDLIMKFLLQRRHLAPTHGAIMYVPTADHDPLLIGKVPDFFITGHIHRMSAANYRNVTMVNASTWVDTSDEQIKRGLEPQPGRLPIINLQTREMKILNFHTP